LFNPEVEEKGNYADVENDKLTEIPMDSPTLMLNPIAPNLFASLLNISLIALIHLSSFLRIEGLFCLILCFSFNNKSATSVIFPLQGSVIPFVTCFFYVFKIPFFPSRFLSVIYTSH